MSFILDALEHARQEQAIADGTVAAATRPATVVTARSPWVRVLLLVLILSLIVIVLLLVRVYREADVRKTPARMPPVAQVFPAAAEAAEAAVFAAQPIVQVQMQVERAADPDLADAVSHLYSAARRADRPATFEGEESSLGAAENGAATSVTSAISAADSKPAQPDALGDAAFVEGASLDIDSLVAHAEAVLDNLHLPAHSAPLLEQLSQTIRDAIPTLMYSQHDYRSSGGESAVLINRERGGEGDSISGVRIQEILPDSVVLEHRGTVFRLRALNSWVNL